MIHLKDTDLYVVPVPKEATKIRVENNYLVYYNNKTNGSNSQIYWLDGKFEILGEVAVDMVSFDVEPFVECISRNLEIWRNYKNVSCFIEYQAKSKEESFYSLLEANGVYFKNPMERNNCIENNGEDTVYGDDYSVKNISQKQYNSYQSKLIEKAVIIKKK